MDILSLQPFCPPDILSGRFVPPNVLSLDVVSPDVVSVYRKVECAKTIGAGIIYFSFMYYLPVSIELLRDPACRSEG